MEKIKIGKIVEIEGINIVIQITEKDIADKITFKIGNKITPVLINKLISVDLFDGVKIIGRIEKIYDKNHYYDLSTFENKKKEDKICIECILIGTYNEFLKKFDEGISNFPLINSSIYSVTSELKKEIIKIQSKYRMKIGKSYNDSSVDIYANPDILLGKHLGIFGNTGTGKSCTVASIIQGLKRRVEDRDGEKIESIKPKIIIFDSNNEYSRAFEGSEFKIKKIAKSELFLPHEKLSDGEYYKLFGASQGVQAPTLKKVLKELRNTGHYSITSINENIKKFISTNSKKNDGTKDNFSFSQWWNWLSTMINRIERIAENNELIKIIDTTNINTLESIKNDNENEVFIIDSDFEKEEIDIIMFLFSKILYNELKNQNIVLVLEEAHRYINEDDREEYKLGNYYIEKIAREGRKFGISLIVSSQRPSELSKTVISQCNSFIIHKITNKNDFELLNRVISQKNKNYGSLLSGLERQHALVCGEGLGYDDIVKIETASPTPKSDDPEVIDKWIG